MIVFFNKIKKMQYLLLSTTSSHIFANPSYMRINPVWDLQCQSMRHFLTAVYSKMLSDSQTKLASGAVKIEDVDHRRRRLEISETNCIYFPHNLCLQPSVIVLLLRSCCLETCRDSAVITGESRLTFEVEKKK